MIKNINNSSVLFALFCVLSLAASCQTKTPVQNSSVNQPVNNVKETANRTAPDTEANKGRSDNMVKDTDQSTTISLSTPAEAYKSAYAARKNKDIKALKSTFSKEILEFFTSMGKAEQKTLDEEITQLANAPQAATDEIRNEKISGEKATLEYPDETGKWKTMDLVKESDGWKLTIPDAKSRMSEKVDRK